MLLLRHPLFIIASSLFWLNQIIERMFGVYIPIMHEYLDDLLCMPVVLSIAMQLVQLLHPLGDLYTFGRSHILLIVALFTIIFELILPASSAKYTSDLLDVLCYLIGAWVFYRIHVVPRKTLIERLSFNSHKSEK